MSLTDEQRVEVKKLVLETMLSMVTGNHADQNELHRLSEDSKSDRYVHKTKAINYDKLLVKIRRELLKMAAV